MKEVYKGFFWFCILTFFIMNKMDVKRDTLLKELRADLEAIRLDESKSALDKAYDSEALVSRFLDDEGVYFFDVEKDGSDFYLVHNPCYDNEEWQAKLDRFKALGIGFEDDTYCELVTSSGGSSLRSGLTGSDSLYECTDIANVACDTTKVELYGNFLAIAKGNLEQLEEDGNDKEEKERYVKLLAQLEKLGLDEEDHYHYVIVNEDDGHGSWDVLGESGQINTFKLDGLTYELLPCVSFSITFSEDDFEDGKDFECIERITK